MLEALQLDLSDLPRQQAAPLTLDLSDLPKVEEQSSEGAVRGQDLKPVQISDLIDKMLHDAQRLYLTGRQAPQEENPWGTGTARMPDLWDRQHTDARPPGDTNTGKNINADTNMLESSGKPDQPRITEVITFDPVGHGRSSFGHTAININGVTYAFTEKGWNKETETAKYLADNHFRNAVGQELNLTPEEQALLLKVIKQDMADNPKWSPENSCVTKVRDALEQATGRMFGIRPQPPIIGPLDFRDNLDRFGYVVKKNWYPRRAQ